MMLVVTQPKAVKNLCSAIAISMLREIDANEMSKLFSQGIEDEIPKNDFAKLVPSILRMSQIFSDNKTLKPG